MSSYRGLIRAGAALAMALAFVMGSVLAEEIYGVITKVDPAAKKITVYQKKADKEIDLEVGDDALLITAKDESGSKVDLEKLEKQLTKAKEKNADTKGIFAKIEYEGTKVKKIDRTPKKKAAAN
ncbi:hypothetical protein [Paludisphaera rhizosphaerae]|uniref:hypothetical protein n=1 Tax=Paludisphaera rhizosphaerae TaxID=2711216 RepID=UPI0013EDA3AD|nr:hypothetical protein [Paludisphaera rhizosphaerae]